MLQNGASADVAAFDLTSARFRQMED